MFSESDCVSFQARGWMREGNDFFFLSVGSSALPLVLVTELSELAGVTPSVHKEIKTQMVGSDLRKTWGCYPDAILLFKILLLKIICRQLAIA